MNRDIKEAKKFGIVLSIILIVIGAVIPTLKKTHLHLWAVYLAGIIFVISFFFTNIFIPFFKSWLKVAQIIGKIISTIILSVFFYFIITPIGFIMRCFGRDPLNRAWYKDVNTYWIRRDPKLNDPKRIEKQF